jgi:hypothetical protein
MRLTLQDLRVYEAYSSHSRTQLIERGRPSFCGHERGDAETTPSVQGRESKFAGNEVESRRKEIQSRRKEMQSRRKEMQSPRKRNPSFSLPRIKAFQWLADASKAISQVPRSRPPSAVVSAMAEACFRGAGVKSVA